jgi:hypothetical protein
MKHVLYMIVLGLLLYSTTWAQGYNNGGYGRGSGDVSGSPSNTGIVYGPTFIGTGTPSISGGGNLAVGSNSFSGAIGNIAATSNVLSPGFTCAHYPVMTLNDITSGAVIALTARSTTSITFAGTATHEVDYSGATCT